MPKIKVLRIIGRLNIGGPAQHVVILNEGLDKGNFDSLLIAGQPESTEANMNYLMKDKKITHQFMPYLRRGLNLVNDILAFCAILRVILKFKPDIIHTHTAKAGALGRFAGLVYNIFAEKKARLVHTFHGHVLKGYFNRFLTNTFVLIERFLAVFTDKIITVSESVRKDLLNLGIANPGKINVIPLGVDLERFLSVGKNNTSDNSNFFRTGIVGRLVPVKNHKMFIEAAKLYLSDCRNRSAKFIVIGDGELKHELQKWVKQIKLDDVIEFKGWLRDLSEVYANLDVVCLTSLNEGTPVSIIEAMAAGRPIVATDVGGVRELLTGSSNPVLDKSKNLCVCKHGILVKSYDAESFSQGLKILSKNEELRNKIGEAGREFVENKFSKRRLISDIENLYFSLEKRRA